MTPDTTPQEFKPQERLQELVGALKEASDHLAEIYAKYQTRIGPFASQSQRINVRARAALESHAQILLQHLAEAQAEVERLRADASIVRDLLAYRVAGSGLYIDDGEVQDNTMHPCIDFKRDTAEDIRAKLVHRNMKGFAT